MVNGVECKIIAIKSVGWVFLLLTALVTVPAVFAQAGDKVVIAHRAASGYLMEHNLPSVALAVAMGSDYIEQDLVMTKDDQVIVLHDPTLERVSNVAELFPGRNRQDGKFYALDFTLAEIKQLHLKEPYPNSGAGEGRFPDYNANLQLTIPTFKEELELIRGLEKTLRREIGIYPEIKQPWLHRKEGKDISIAVLKTLYDYGYKSKESKVYLQCFDPDELKRIHDELMPPLQMGLKLIQLIDSNNGDETKVLEWGEWVRYNYDWILSKSGLRSLSSTIAGIGLDKSMLVDEAGSLLRPTLVSDAHSLGMVVHAYTFRRGKESLPPYIPPSAASFEALLEFFYFKVGVDGVFTDYCGDAVLFLQKRVAPPELPPEPASETSTEVLPAQPAVTPESPVIPEPPQPAVVPEIPGAPRSPEAQVPEAAPVARPAVAPVAAPLPTQAPAVGLPESTIPPSPANTPESLPVRRL